ncbi:MAG: type III-A CRISPR-associated protein Csm2 [Thermodesulfobacteriota bacterium]|nr:type III-A CRISPR-associated protein Csm2 [Thermodesulfobacteriota bacterium]
MGFYYDDAGNLKAGLLDEQAKREAERFVHTNNKKDKLNANQLRRFYNECKNLEKRFSFAKQKQLSESGSAEAAAHAAFLQVLPLIKMLKAKVSYAANPSNPKIPRTFSVWLNTSIDGIEDAKDFEAFLLSFEAVVGYSYGAGIS